MQKGRVGKLEADIKQVSFVQFFLKFSQYCCETSRIKNNNKKKKKKKNIKNLFFKQKTQKSLYYWNR